jgi:uracil-DNA glycosylase family 4
VATLAEQVHRHLLGLKAAGVEFLSMAGPPPEELLRPAVDETVTAKANEPHPLPLLAAEYEKCTKCPELAATRLRTVPGVGPTNPELYILGDAPQKEDVEKGEPFLGSSEEILRNMLKAMGLTREEVYLSTAIRCRPPGNRTPSSGECSNCRGFLLRELDLVKPKFILCFGTVASQSLLQSNETIVALRGRMHDFQGTPVLCTYHPGYLLKTPNAKKDAWEDLKLLMRTMGRG